MSDQFALPGFDPVPPPRQRPPTVPRPAHALFFALVPDPQAAQRVVRLAEALCREHGLPALPLPAGRLHVTLHDLGDFDAAGVPADRVARACEAASRLLSPPLDLVFDRVLSFRGRPGAAHPLVLRCNEAGDAAIAALRDALGQVLLDHGVPHQPAGTAHVTLLYDRAEVAEQPVPSWRWTVQELALVHSHVGQGRHERRGTWTLGSA